MLSALIRGAVRRPVAVISVTLVALVLGALSISSLPVGFYPAVRVPKLTVATSYPGLPARETLELVTVPVEDTLSSLQGLRRVKSTSLDGISLVELSFSWGTDMREAGIEAREAADIAALSLPEDAAKPMVLPVNPTERPILAIGIFPRSGLDAMALKRLCDREIRTMVQQAEGVGSIEILGGLDEEILVEPDPARAISYGLSPEAIAEVIQASNVEIPAGSIERGPIEYVVKTDAAARTAADIADIMAVGEDARVRLGDVARVTRGADDRSSFVLKDGREGVALLVRAQGGYSPVTLSRNVRAKLAEIDSAYGSAVEAELLRDGSAAIAESLRNLVYSALLGLLAAFAVIFAYMREFRTSLVMIASVPLSLVMAIAAFPLAGVGLNAVSIGGLAIGIGMLVDDSIVVLENVQRKSLPGDAEGVIAATVEIASSTAVSTLTSVIVFLPLFFLPGIAGAVFRDLAWAVSLSLLFSFVVSITVIPVLYRAFGPSAHRAGDSGKAYRAALRLALRHPWIVAATSALLLALGALSFTGLERDWLGAPESDEYAVEIGFPAGTSPERLMEVARKLGKEIGKEGFAASAFCRAGGDLSDPYYLATKSAERETLVLEIALAPGSSQGTEGLERWVMTTLAGEGAERATARSSALAFSEALGLPSGEEVAFAVTDESHERARRKAEGIVSGLGRADASVSPKEARPQIVATPDRDALSRIGISPADVATALGGSVFGVYAGSIEGKSARVPVRVRYPAAARYSSADVGLARVRAPSGATVALRELVDFRESVSAPAYYRENRRDAVYVTLDERDPVAERALAERASDASADEWNAQIPALALLFALAVFLMYALLGIQFDSFVLPLLMLAILPFGFAGVFIALFATGSALNLNAILGSLVVIGFIVRNGIIFYDRYSRVIRAPGGITPGIYRGSCDRIRAISMSFLSTLLALVPIAADLAGRNPERAMAIAIIGGLAFSSFLSLFIFPAIFRLWFASKAGAR